MVNATRSPFGELVYRARRRLGLTRWELAERSQSLAASDAEHRPISERTIAAIERRSPGGVPTRAPRPSTVATLARLFGLEPGSDAHAAFVAAAQDAPASRPSRRAAREPGSEFVVAGREAHLRRIDEKIDTAAAGSGRLVLVSADAGTGKTMIVAEATRRALDRHPGLCVLWTRAISRYGTGPRWEPFRQMLSLMVGDVDTIGPTELVDGRNARELAQRVPAAIRCLAGDASPLVGWLAPVAALATARVRVAIDDDLRDRLDHAIRFRSDREHDDSTAHLAIDRMLDAYATAGPVVLVVDDLHWADSATIATLQHLAHTLREASRPLTVIGAFRPGEVPSPLAALIDEVGENALVDLSTTVGGDAGRAFVDAMVASLDIDDESGVAQALFDRTAGLPYFVVSYLRLRNRNDGLTAAVEDTGVPGDIGSVFAQQLYRLTPEAQLLLAAASVQGATFLAEPLARVLGLGPEQLGSVLDSRLARRYRMVRDEGTTTVDGVPMGRYAFAHALLRDYLYHRLTTMQRTHLHRTTAEALTEILGAGPHDGAEMIATHRELAGDRIRAAAAWEMAGVHALLIRDHERAAARFERILALGLETTTPDAHIRSLIGLGNSDRGMGATVRARERLQHALALAVRHRLPVIEAQALESLAMIEFDEGDMQRAADHLTVAVERYRDAGLEGDLARATSNHSTVLHGLGRYDDAMALADISAETAARIGNDRTWVSARNARATCLIDLGQPDAALAIYRDCIERCIRHGLAHHERLCWLNTGLAHIELERWEVAREATERVRRDGAETTTQILGAAEFNSGLIAEGMDDLPRARRHYADSLTIREGNGQVALRIDSLAGLLRVATYERRSDEMHRLLAEIETLLGRREIAGVEHPGRLFRTLIESNRQLGHADRADAWLAKATAFLDRRAACIEHPANRATYRTVPAANRWIAHEAGHPGDTLESPETQ